MASIKPNTDILNLQSNPNIDNLDIQSVNNITDLGGDNTIIPEPVNLAPEKNLLNNFIGITQNKAKIKKERLNLSPAEQKAFSEANGGEITMFDTDFVNKGVIDLGGINDSFNNIYQDLNNGDSIAKFDIYTSGIDNEDYLSSYQSGTDKWINGAGKFIAKTGANVLDATIGTVYGLYEGITEGDFELIYNNDFSKFVDDLNTQLDYKLPNYLSKEEQNMTILSKLGTANFWANDVLSGLSFLAGTMVSETLWAAATWGSSLATSIPRTLLKAEAKGIAKGLGKSAGKKYYKNTLKMFKAYSRTVPKNKALRALNDVRFFYTSAGYEAGVEARQSLNESFNSYLESFEKIYGRKPTLQEREGFLSQATKNSNLIFAANIPLIATSNIVQLGQYLGVGTSFNKSLSKATGKLFGLGIERGLEGGKVVFKSLKPKKWQRVLGNVAYALEAPFTEGVIEEGGQSVISNTSQKWLEAKFNPDALKDNYDLIDAAIDSASETYDITNPAFNEVGIGMIIGILGSVGKRSELTGKRTPFNIGNYSQAESYYDTLGDKKNDILSKLSQTQIDFLNRLVATNQLSAFAESAKRKSENGDNVAAALDWDIAQFTKMLIDDNADMLEESAADFKMMLNNMDDVELAKTFNISVEEVNSFKEAMEITFDNNLSLFKKATNIAESLHPGEGIGSDFKKDFALNIYLGVKSGQRLDEIASLINELVGTSGLASALRFYTNLDKKAKRRVERIEVLNNKIAELEREYSILQNSFLSTETSKVERVSENKKVGKAIDDNRVKAEKVRAELVKKRNELEELLSKLEDKFRNKDFKFDTLFSNQYGLIEESDLESSIKELSKLDKYINDLKESNPVMAGQLQSLLFEYSKTMRTFVSFQDNFNEMSNPNYATKLNNKYAKIYEKIYNSIDDSGVKEDPIFGESIQSIEELIKANPDLTEEAAQTIRVLHKLSYNVRFNNSFNTLLTVDNNLFEDVKLLDKINSGDKEAFATMVEKVANKLYNGVALSIHEKKFYDNNKKEVYKLLRKIRKNKGDNVKSFGKKIRVNKELKSPLERVADLINQIKKRNSYLSDKDLLNDYNVEKPSKRDYIDFEKLYKKKQKGNISPKELIALNKLKDKINKWGALEGAIAGDFTLSDLIEQYLMLRGKTPNGSDILADLMSEDDLIDESEFTATVRQANYDHLQSYDTGMVALLKNINKYAISNISLSGFLNSFNEAVAEVSRKGRKLNRINNVWDINDISVGDVYTVKFDNGDAIKIEIGSGNNILLTKRDRELLHRNTPIRLKALGLLPSNYTPLYKVIDGEYRKELVPVRSDFVFNGGEKVDNDAVQSLKKGDEISLSVDLDDSYNKTLLSKLNKQKKSLFTLKDRLLKLINLSDSSGEEEFDELLSHKASENRRNGFYIKDGVKYERQSPLVNRPIGEGGVVKFTDVDSVTFKYKVISADELQPSHENGVRNPKFFITEAQPKNRKDLASIKQSDKIARNPKFEEVSSNSLAYSGAPVVNKRGEVIQGNNRADGLKKHYKSGGKIYKEALLKNAEKFGLSKEEILKVKNPILVREVEVDDATAIRLGNYDVKDIETGGSRRIDPNRLSNRLPFDVKRDIVNILFKDSDDVTLNQSLRDNFEAIVSKLSPYLSDTQLQSLYKNGVPTPETIKDLEQLVLNFMLQGGQDLQDKFENMSHVARQGLIKSLPKILGTPLSYSLLPNIQTAISIYDSFLKSGIDSFDLWLNQYSMFSGGANIEGFNPLDIAIARLLIEASTIKDIKNTFSKYTDLINGKEADLFEPAIPPKSKFEAIKEVFHVDVEGKLEEKVSQEEITEINKKIIELEEKYEEAKQDFIDNLVVIGRDTNGKLVGVFKSTKNTPANGNDKSYYKLREERTHIAETILSKPFNFGGVIELNMSIPVDYVYIGHPNILLYEDNSGKVFVDYNSFTDRDLENILSIGYMLDGELHLNKKLEDIEVYPFMSKIKRDKKYKGKKVPLVVLNFKGRKIAYPVSLKTVTMDNSGKIDEILSTNIDTNDKILKINKVLLESGISVAKFGVTFDNFTKEYISELKEMLKEVVSKPDVTKWVNFSDNSILKTEAKINLKLNDKFFFSPKVKSKIADINIVNSSNSNAIVNIDEKESNNLIKNEC